MPDVETQLREYFHAGVERITAEDVAAGRHVFERDVPASAPRARRPAWVAVGAFAATVVALGGALGAGLLVRSDGTAPSGRSSVEPIADAVPTGSAFLVLAVALVIGLVAGLVVHTGRPLRRRQETMATTLDTAPPEAAAGTPQRNRGLVVTIVILAIALVALAGWVVYDQSSQAETAAPAAVEEVINDYMAAWDTGDGEAFSAVTTEDYEFFNPQGSGSSGPYDRELIRAQIETAGTASMTFERVGDLIVSGDGPYYVSGVDPITTGGGTVFDGISAWIVVDTGDGLKVALHTYIGEA